MFALMHLVKVAETVCCFAYSNIYICIHIYISIYINIVALLIMFKLRNKQIFCRVPNDIPKL